MDPIDPWKWIGHIWAAYVISAAVLTALVLWLRLDARRQQRIVDELGARGVKRLTGQS